MQSEPTFLITGGTGFLGSFLAYRVLQQGGRPLVLVRPRDGMTGWARFLTGI